MSKIQEDSMTNVYMQESFQKVQRKIESSISVMPLMEKKKNSKMTFQESNEYNLFICFPNALRAHQVTPVKFHSPSSFLGKTFT